MLYLTKSMLHRQSVLLILFFISRHINHRLLLASDKPPYGQDYVIARSTSHQSGRLTNMTSKEIKRTDSGCKELLGMWPVINLHIGKITS